MKSSIRVLLLALLTLSSSLTAQKPAYTLFNKNGKEVDYQKMISACAKADIVFFGEQHNNPISHWLQVELTQDLYDVKDGKITLGAEMFETDGQLIMDEYFAGLISTKKFEEEMRLWPNYKTDYKPLLEFAKDSGLKFVATNVPRRYANMTYNLGLDTLNYLSEDAKRLIAPLPLEYDTSLNCYSSLVSGGPMGHGSENFRDAQAIKDATMSHFILENLEEGAIFIHYNGAYHSDNFESLYYFIEREKRKLKIVTISTVDQEKVFELEKDNEGLADFIIAVPETMTKTN